MKRLCLLVVGIFLMMSCADDISTSPGKVGWAIGRRPDLTVAIIING